MPDLDVSRAHDIDEVIARMEAIDAALPDADGVKWFNRLYLHVTRNVKAHLAIPAQWRDRGWMVAMVPVFANLYFDAVDAWQRGTGACPRAWRPLFQARHDAAIARVQFALAGMNAHINRDLPYAIRTNCQDRGTRPDRDLPFRVDYLFVNQILEESEHTAMHDPSVGLVADLPFGLPPLTDVLAMWSVREARAAAWVAAEMLWSLPAPLGEMQMEAIDAYVGGFSRGMLVHLPFMESADASPISSVHASRRASIGASELMRAAPGR